MAQHDSQTPLSSRDLWSTPEWLIEYLKDQYDFQIDLCASKDNTKLDIFIDEEMDGLRTDWMDYITSLGVKPIGFCNPPYSDVKSWIRVAIAEQKDGFTSVFVIPTPNGELYYEELFENASKITFIHGRVAFVASCDYEKIDKKGNVTKIKKGQEVSGNTRGTCIVEFKYNYLGSQTLQIEHVNRDEIRDTYDL